MKQFGVALPASLAGLSDSSASSSGHNINNVDDSNDGKSSSVDFLSGMNQRLNNLDIIDPVANKQSEFVLQAGSTASKRLAPITANKSSPVTDPAGFPTSDFFQRANHLIVTREGKEKIFNNVMDIWQQGAETGCIPSMINYAGNTSQHKPHLGLPLLLEGAIRGHPHAVVLLVDQCYEKSEPLRPFSLCMYWSKMVKNWVGIEGEKYRKFLEEEKKMNNDLYKHCNICGKQESDLVDLKTCNGCKLPSYCSKQCQTIDWEEGTHKNECNQLKILMKYHEPYANEIREQIMRGDDPKTMISLQKLRNKLGLTRPRKEYEEYLDDSIIFQINRVTINPSTLLIPRNNGTVYVGSWTEKM
ncbi:hypothetical protein FRACYDRAFT_252770 [Fragilariopsis cylindrus CCMP1102]|uniref:MYND-type domain-containing protein n=1 Tax=Fragilariopsis cylindrus CCMP1102 TaxID=635003 RepID=A0A1E7ELS7_9STRA|nr:hypothetical protein FRACYDRAFT_252770 [Fragilariopsis cylindrus CCMP1102]|eukprot:OEU06870.1 hypothetical protein FRACYDRAFT_252770 [Fragilariopsis cylindrus CCMP1102]